MWTQSKHQSRLCGAGDAAGAGAERRAPRPAEPHPGGAVQAHRRQALRRQRAHQRRGRHDHAVRACKSRHHLRCLLCLQRCGVGTWTTQGACRARDTRPGSKGKKSEQCACDLAGSRPRIWPSRWPSPPATTTAACRRRWRPSARWASPESCGVVFRIPPMLQPCTDTCRNGSTADNRACRRLSLCRPVGPSAKALTRKCVGDWLLTHTCAHDRQVGHLERRLAEAAKLGFTQVCHSPV